MKYFIAIILSSNYLFASYIVKQTIESGKKNIESVTRVSEKTNRVIKLRSIQEFILEKEKTKSVTFEEILYPDNRLPNHLKEKAEKRKKLITWAGSEVRQIIRSGRESNRINLTILGDGYTEKEKELYFKDVNRIVDDMFKGKTFKSYLKLFNIYAIFVPSEDSGITDIDTKNTAFDLYRRPKGSKRGIMPGNRAALEKALRLIPHHTDYPIIIANDDFYGGLGGRYAITTRSLSSGSMVLRHELGHNFSDVGEEYDGGYVYSGANFSSTKNVSWSHWVKGKLEVHDSQFLTGAYIWQDLGKKEYKEQFNFPLSSDYSYDLRISSVGWESAEDVKVLLDGKALKLNGLYTEDRSFFRTQKVQLSSGAHEISIIDNNKDGNNILAYANGYAYPKTYNFTPNLVGAFNVFDSNQNRRGYRPTHNQCLMRDMRSDIFCPVDQENIWIKFLQRISLIDTVYHTAKITTVKTLELSGLSYKWFRVTGWPVGKKEEIVELRNKKSVKLSSFGKGKYEVEVSFQSKEIRKKNKVTVDRLEFKI